MNIIIFGAVRNRRRLRFWYGDEFLTVEPHCYGRNADGSESLVGFQLGTNAWRWFHVPWMTRISPMTETFEPRPDYTRDEPGVTEVVAQV